MLNTSRKARILLNGLCWFVHVHKCAGTSMRNALWTQHLGLMVLNDGRDPYKDWHVKPADIELSSRFSFAFVRNPWDRIVSAYRGVAPRMNFNNFLTIALDDSLPQRTPAKSKFELASKLAKRIGCDKVVRIRIHTRPYNHQNYMLNEVDFVGRFENIAEDWAHVMKQIDRPGVRLPHTNDSKRTKPYAETYTPKTRKLVTNYYADDIAKYGYSFDD